MSVMTMARPQQVAALGRAVYEARGRLGLTQEAFAARAGLSSATLRRIERAGRDDEFQVGAPQVTTLYAIDRGLGWAEGTARNILDGEKMAEPEAYVSKTISTGKLLADASVEEMLEEMARRAARANPDSPMNRG